MKIENFIKKLIQNRFLVLLFMAIIAVYGFYSYYTIPKQENPNTTVAAAVLTTVYPGASPQEVETQVTNLIEDQLKTIPEIDYFTSMNMNSASVVVIMYKLDAILEDVAPPLRQKISDIQGQLPDLCQETTVDTDVVPNNQFIISLSSDVYSGAELEEYAKTIKSSLIKVNGVTSITIDGEAEKRVVVECDIQQMRHYGISIENVLQIMQAQNLSIPSGSISYESGSINVSAPAVFESIKDIENTVVNGATDSLSFVKLKDIAKVYIEDVSQYTYYQDGRDAVLLTGTLEKGENAVIIGKDLRKAIDKVKNEMPPELIFHEVMYAPEDIDVSINNFIKNLMQSIALIVVVVMVGVQLRNGLVISVALPLSILITFIAMSVMGIEFQFISIAALIVSLGILVDNAIVISEAIQQNLNKGIEKIEAITSAVKVTALPVFTSTLTTVVTFGIIYFVPGTVGQVAGAIPSVVIASLTASYFIAMCVIPVLAYLFFKPESEKKVQKDSFVKRFFDKLLEIGLKHKRKTIYGAFATLFIAAVLVSQLGLQFFPYANKAVVYINVTGETMSLENTKIVSEDIEKVLEKSPLVENYTYAVGKGMPSFFLTVPRMNPADNAAQFMVQLKKESFKKMGGAEACARELQNEIDQQVAGATVEVKCLEYSLPTEAKITLSVSGQDTEKVQQVANTLTQALEEITGTDYVRNTAVIPQYQYKVELDSDELSAYGLLKYDVVKQLNTSLMGAVASTYSAGGSQLDIVVKSNVQTLDELYDLPIIGSVSGTKVLLGQISKIGIEPTVPLINHYNGEKYINVLSNVLPGYSAAKIEKELNDRYLANMDLEGVEVTSRGEIKNMLDLVLNLGISAIFAVGIIYLILLLQFRDLKKPLNVLSSIPLSLIGCCFGLWIFKMDIQVMALLGLVSLFGIVVNNGILLIEVIDAEIATGKDIHTACKAAVDQRFRPILLSSTTTCIGLVPLIIANDPMTAPMASVLLFGLLFSTILTMVVVPTIYALNAEKAQRKKLK